MNDKAIDVVKSAIEREAKTNASTIKTAEELVKNKRETR